MPADPAATPKVLRVFAFCAAIFAIAYIIGIGAWVYDEASYGHQSIGQLLTFVFFGAGCGYFSWRFLRVPADPAATNTATRAQPLMCVEAPQLLAAAEELGDERSGLLHNGVRVTAAQLRTAGEILRDGPQPIANGIKANMPGFIDRRAQPRKGALVFTVGILPSRTYRITKRGVAREVAA